MNFFGGAAASVAPPVQGTHFKNGQYRLSTQRWPNHYCYMQDGIRGNVTSWSGDAGPQGWWQLINHPSHKGQFLLSTSKWPQCFVFMEQGLIGSCRGWNKCDPGPQGYWKLVPHKDEHGQEDGYHMITPCRPGWEDKWYIYVESGFNGNISSWSGDPGPQGLFKVEPWNININNAMDQISATMRELPAMPMLGSAASGYHGPDDGNGSVSMARGRPTSQPQVLSEIRPLYAGSNSTQAIVGVSPSTERASPRRPASVDGNGNTAVSLSASKLRPRIASPLRSSSRQSLEMAAPAAPAEVTEVATPAPAPTATPRELPRRSSLEPSPSPISVRQSELTPRPGSKVVLLKNLADLRNPNTEPQVFKELCRNICGHTQTFVRNPDSSDADTLHQLGETVVSLLQKLVKESFEEEKFKGTLLLLEAFGEQTEWRRAETGKQLVFDIIREILKLFNRRGLGKERIADVNMGFVKCLTNLPPRTAYWALLEILKEEDKILSLVIKCLKKVEKKAGTAGEACPMDKAEREGRSVMEVVLSSRQSVLKLTSQTKRQAWLDGAKEVVEIARRCLPEVVDDCFVVTLAAITEVDDRRLLEELWGKSASVDENRGNEENVPISPAKTISKFDSPTKSSLARARTPERSSPCRALNA